MKLTIYGMTLLMLLCAAAGCATGREFWTYVVEEPVSKPLKPKTDDQPISEPLSPHYVKVNFNDGHVATEIQIPVLSSGQQIVIDHKGRPADKSINLLPLPPTSADKSLVEAYLKNGGTITSTANPVSLVRTQAEIRKLAKQGQYGLALEYATQLLERYPNHVETLRSKGALLLKMGESHAALEAYQKAQDLQADPRVQKQIETLQKKEELQ